MKTIIPNKIEPEKYMVYSPEGTPYSLNYYEFNDLRIQIKTHRITGWTIVIDGELKTINEYGKYSGRAFYKIADQLFQLL